MYIDLSEPVTCSTFITLPEVLWSDSTVILVATVTNMVYSDGNDATAGSPFGNFYTVTPTEHCFGTDILPFVIENMKILVGDAFNAFLSLSSSCWNLDLTISVTEEGNSQLPEGLFFDSETLVFNGSV